MNVLETRFWRELKAIREAFPELSRIERDKREKSVFITREEKKRKMFEEYKSILN